MTMVERIGISVMAQLEDRKGFKHVIDPIQFEDRELWEEILNAVGRASIQAMLEPTEEMKRAAFDMSGERSWPTLYWQAMLQAALDEKP